MLLCIQELAEQGSSKPQDTSELLAMKEQVSKLTAEKGCSCGEEQKDLQREKRLVSTFIKQSTSFIHPVFIRIFFNQIRSPPKIVKDSGEHGA